MGMPSTLDSVFFMLGTLIWQVNTDTILEYDEMGYGHWYPWDNCSANSFAASFEIKADIEERSFYDNEGMTGIRLYCVNQSNRETTFLEPHSLFKGNWKGKLSCPNGTWLTAFKLRIESYRGVFLDDSAVNDIIMKCGDPRVEYYGGGTSEGVYQNDWLECPKGQAICGVRSKVDDEVITDVFGVTALEMKCCDLLFLNVSTTKASSASTAASKYNQRNTGSRDSQKNTILMSKELGFGKLFDWDYCPNNSYARAFQIRSDREASVSFVDNEGMVGVRLYCENQFHRVPKVIQSYSLSIGGWKAKQSCPPGEWLIGLKVRMEDYQGRKGDGKAVNYLEMKCSSGQTYDGAGTSAGIWGDWNECPKGQVICGVKTKADIDIITDRMRLVSLRMICCNLVFSNDSSDDALTTFSFYQPEQPTPGTVDETALKETGNTTMFAGGYSGSSFNYSLGFTGLFKENTSSDATITQTPDTPLRNPETSNHDNVTQPTLGNRVLMFADIGFGKWHDWGMCPNNSYASAFDIKDDVAHGVFMTGFRLHCRNEYNQETSVIQSYASPSGSWKGVKSCSDGGRLTGFRLREESYQGLSYIDSGNFLQMTCSSGETFGGRETSQEYWGELMECRIGQAICGVSSKVDTEPMTRTLGIVALRLKCCSLSALDNESTSLFSSPVTIAGYTSTLSERSDVTVNSNTFPTASTLGSTIFTKTKDTGVANLSSTEDDLVNRKDAEDEETDLASDFDEDYEIETNRTVLIMVVSWVETTKKRKTRPPKTTAFDDAETSENRAILFPDEIESKTSQAESLPIGGYG